MAKVGVIKFNYLGKDMQVNVNCNSGGIFSANIPEEVANALQIGKTLSATTMSEIQKQFDIAMYTFKNATRTEHLMLLIAYKAAGEYTYVADRSRVMFGGYNHKYGIEMSYWNHISAVGFEFDIVIKECVNAKVKYYEARKGDDIGSERHKEDHNKWYKWQEVTVREGHKLIPFSEEALSTLQKAENTMRNLSEMLFNFIEQEPDKIEEQLKNKILLGNGNN